MKQFIWLEFCRDWKKTRGRFVALVLLATLGVGFLVGLRSTPPMISASVDAYFAQKGVADLSLTAYFGFTDRDIQGVSAISGVNSATGGHLVDGFLGEHLAKVVSYSQDSALNLPVLIQGEFPENPNECAVDPLFLEESGLKIGDSVELSIKGEEGEPFRLVGTVEHPLFPSPYRGVSSLGVGEAEGFVLVLQDVFPKDSYTHLYLGVNQEELPHILAEIDEMKEEVGAEWGENLMEEVSTQLDEMLADLQVAQSDQDRVFARENARLELERVKISFQWKDYQEELEEFYTLSPDSEEFHQREEELEAWRLELQLAESAQFEALLTYQQQVEKADLTLDDKRKEIEQNRRNMALIAEERWKISTPKETVGWESVETDLQQMGQLSFLFPVVFFAVAMLVSVSTMMRTMESQRVTLGTKKALGCTFWEVGGKFLLYAGSALFVGGFLGILGGTVVIPRVIFYFWSKIYHTGPLMWEVYPEIAGTALLLGILLVLCPTMLGCRLMLRHAPAQLMRPKPPQEGRRVFLEKVDFLWYGLTFYQKITMRNLIRYRQRFWGSVLGIAGCTTLIVTAFGLGDSFTHWPEVQYQQIYRHSTQITLVDQVTPLELEEITQILEQYSLEDLYLPVNLQQVQVETEQGSQTASLYLGENSQQLGERIRMQLGQFQFYNMPENGVVVSQKLAEQLGVSLGDTITIHGVTSGEGIVSALTQQFTGHHIYMTSSYYSSIMNDEPEYNHILVEYGKLMIEYLEYGEQLDDILLNLDGIKEVRHLKDAEEFYTNSINSIQPMIWIMKGCASILAFSVLYVLSNGNITRQQRELATLKVLGYHNNEVSDYMFRENFFLTFYGMLLGIILGANLHTLLIPPMELENLMLYRDLRVDSYLAGAGLTVFFSVVVNALGYFRVKKLDMVSALKAVE